MAISVRVDGPSAFQARLRLRPNSGAVPNMGADDRIVVAGATNGDSVAHVHGGDGASLQRLLQMLAPSSGGGLVLGRSGSDAVCVTSAMGREIPLPAPGLHCTAVPPVVIRDGAIHLTVVGPASEYATMLQTLRPWGEVRVEAKRNLTRANVPISIPTAELLGGLTRRQLGILRRAYARGYYSAPKGTSLKDLANEFQIAPSTLAEHLQKAERASLSAFLRLLADADEPTASLRGMGRPKDTRR